MILGIGNDIVSVERIENLLNKFGERFIKKVFTKEEETRSLKNFKPAASLAKRFAAKEAAWKALGDERQIGINWKDMGVRNNKSGKPFLELTGKAAEQLKNLTPENMVARIDLSLTDELLYAQAFVIISAQNEKKNLQDCN
ncbi:MAG: holo-ACP synthase [Rhodospirillaceae bacterium]|nr:holo-ACP synthase [Rhodospirillaceae bacterium]|tara:strand:+ start:312 stop:734 length:423 start_codon:yes stop_codon:yes gene_type:complete